MEFNKDKYLKRIGYLGNLEPNLATLRKLQKTHLLNVPFENLDIHHKVPIVLSIERIFDKIVNHNRGGFCYELNELFYQLLIALGYDAKRISARVYNQSSGYGQEFDHHAIIVAIDKINYLTDVGFGEFTFEPLKLQIGVKQNDERGNYLIDNYENGYLRVNKIDHGKRIPEYIFKETERELDDFKTMCYYHQTSPSSHFTDKRLITLPTENGRVTISGNTLKIKKQGSTIEKVLENENEFETVLWVKFKIKIEKPANF